MHEHLDGTCDDDDAGSVRAARHMVSTGAYEGPTVDEPSVFDGLAARRGEGGGPHNLADSGVARSVHDELADEVVRLEGAARQATGSVDGNLLAEHSYCGNPAPILPQADPPIPTHQFHETPILLYSNF